MVMAASCDGPQPIRFKAGASQAQITGGIARGEIACLTMAARIDQQMVATVSSPEQNVVLQIYAPGWHIGKQDDVYAIRGMALPGVAEGSDAKAWHGRLPASGTYLVVLGTTRGGADYRLDVAIK